MRAYADLHGDSRKFLGAHRRGSNAGKREKLRPKKRFLRPHAFRRHVQHPPLPRQLQTPEMVIQGKREKGKGNN